MRDKILKLARYLKSIKCYDELDHLLTVSRAYAEMHAEGEGGWHIVSADVPLKDIRWAGDDLMEWGYWGLPISDSLEPKLGASECASIERWDGTPEGFAIFTHSSTRPIETFADMTSDGFRIARSGLGSLSITFLQDDPKSLAENLRWRVNPENKNYNLGSMVVIAAINPELMGSQGLPDSILDDYKNGDGDPLGPTFIKNVNILEEWGEGHSWHDNSWKLPGRFLYAAYNGINDTICINPDWDGSRATEYGKRLDRNKKEFLSLSESSSSGDLKNNIVSTKDLFEGSEDDFDIF